jgi:YD repeat-containing protein
VTTARTRHDETASVTDGRGNVTQYAYNRDGQQTTVTDPLGQVVVTTTYDPSGRKSTVTDARGTVTRFGYDQRNRIAEQRVDPNGLNLVTLFKFDALGQQIRLTEGANTPEPRVTEYTYDRNGRLKTAIVDPGAGGLQLCTSYSYDHLGNPVAVARGTNSSRNQNVMLHEFDSLGRCAKKIAVPRSLFGYGAPGTRDLTIEYRYDAVGCVRRLINPNQESIWYVYDAAGQLTQI